MTLEEAKARHASVAAEIRRHDHAYYVLATPNITDFEYDLLFKELQELEKAFPSLTSPQSPTQRVGGTPTEAFPRVKHLQPMLSLEKVEGSEHPSRAAEPDQHKRTRMQDENTLQAIKSFDATIRKQLGRDQVEYVMEPKVDGVSIGVHYRHGKFALGVTRGDGLFGDDITTNLRTVRAIPLQLDLQNPPELLEVRGEAYIANNDFQTLNAKLAAGGQKTFPNTRNATAGTLKLLDSRLVAQRPIRAVFYGLGACEGIQFQSHAEMLIALAKFGLPTQSHWWLCKDIADVLRVYREMVVANYNETRDLRNQLPYEIDGIVLKVNRFIDHARIPSKTRAPGHAIVHKPIHWITPAETLLRGITVQVGRTGVLTPVAELDPVFVQGSTISRATLHNEDEIRRKDIRVGDTVVIRKAGMVIPEVLEVLKSKRPPDAEKFDLFRLVSGKCPACGGPITKDKISGGTTEEVAWRCQNVAACPAQLTRRVEYFAARKALDIEALGGIVAERLVERGLVKEPLDLFLLTEGDLRSLNLGTDAEPRVFGSKNAARVMHALERARSLPLNRWILALGIPSVGETTAFQVAHLHRSLDDLAQSRILRKCLTLYEKAELAKSLSPDSRLNMGPVRRKRLALENQSKNTPASEPTKLDHLRAEIQAIAPLEEAEWDFRIQQQCALNCEIKELATELTAAGVRLQLNERKKQKRPHRKQAPPIIEVTADLEMNGIRNILNFFDSTIGQRILRRVRELEIRPTAAASGPSTAPSGIAKGTTFVLTGTLPTLSRDEAAEIIRAAGGSVTGSVSKNTHFLLAGDNPGHKLNRALELRIRVLSEDDLLKMLNLKPKPGKGASQGLLF